VQTPQGFAYPLLKAALDQAREDNFLGTDEAALVERIGKEVVVVEGDPRNIKITAPVDIQIAEVSLED
jgi:2-C-methyl-D-erythritol 4-phosphate cytidylyltransferase